MKKKIRDLMIILAIYLLAMAVGAIVCLRLNGMMLKLFVFAVTAAIFVLWFVQCWIESLFSGEAFTLAKHLDGALLELHGILAFPLIHFYDGRKGKQLTKEFYYLFYPGHLLLILMLVRLLPKC